MKTIVVYYSYSGNTGKVANWLKESLAQTGSVEVLPLVAEDEQKSFFSQAVAGFMKKEAKLSRNSIRDITPYDVVAVGTPVWAFGPAPAVRTFLNQAKNFNNKKLILFSTFGSGAGKDKCMNEMEMIVKDKGAEVIKVFSVQQGELKSPDKVKEKIKEVLKNG